MVDAAPADAVIVLRRPVEQVARRLGMIASSHGQTQSAERLSSGWHLPQSPARNADGRNAFTADDCVFSGTARHYIAGLLRPHRVLEANFNGRTRLNANALSPKRAVRSHLNKPAICRLLGGANSATRLETGPANLRSISAVPREPDVRRPRRPLALRSACADAERTNARQFDRGR